MFIVMKSKIKIFERENYEETNRMRDGGNNKKACDI